MDYGSVMRMENDDGSIRGMSRKEMIDYIYQHFGIDHDNIANACAAAGVRYPDEPIQYYFLGVCISRGLEAERNPYHEDDDKYDLMDEFADSAVPHQTYVIWRLWIEFDYDTDAYRDMGMEPRLDDLENVAQVQLYEYARRIVYYFGDR